MSFLNQFKTDIGIDLGTANSLVYLKGEGIIINEPTTIAINKKTNQVIAIGSEAKGMIGRTPAHVDVVRPLVNGVISDFVMTQEILKYFIKRIKKGSLFRYVRAVISVPTNLTEVERKSVEDAVSSSGASNVYLLEEPIASAIGAGISIDEPLASMVIDIGGGSTEIAVIAMGGVVISKSLKIAGDKINDDIIKFVRDEFKMAIGEITAENIKIEIGSAIPLEKKSVMNIYGRDLSTGLPKETQIKNIQVRSSIAQSLKKIVDAIKEVIEKTPPELSGDLLKRGIYISGGGSMLEGFDKLLEKELNVGVSRVDDPLTAVVRGTGMAIESLDRYKDLFSFSRNLINAD